jgi:hypothetical protein
MTRIALTAFIVLTSATSLLAGKIFGDIKLGDKPIPEGAKITITAPIKPAEAGKPTVTPSVVDSGVTDKFGAYRLNVKEEGKCILSVQIEKQTASLEVFSNANATRYDLVLEKDKDGKYTLKRK